MPINGLGRHASDVLRSTPRLALLAAMTLVAATASADSAGGAAKPPEVRAPAATTTTFAPVADTRFEETHPAAAYGRQRQLSTDGDSGSRIETALRFKVTGPSDATPPSAPAHPRVTSAAQTSLRFNWNRSSDTVG